MDLKKERKSIDKRIDDIFNWDKEGDNRKNLDPNKGWHYWFLLGVLFE